MIETDLFYLEDLISSISTLELLKLFFFYYFLRRRANKPNIYQNYSIFKSYFELNNAISYYLFSLINKVKRAVMVC